VVTGSGALSTPPTRQLGSGNRLLEVPDDVIHRAVEEPSDQGVQLLDDFGVEVDLATGVADEHGDVANHGNAAIALDDPWSEFIDHLSSVADDALHERLLSLNPGIQWFRSGS
jgi:hypothetical protein